MRISHSFLTMLIGGKVRNALESNECAMSITLDRYTYLYNHTLIASATSARS